MITKSDKWSAFKEAALDTAVGSMINVPMNFALISLAFYYELSATQTTALMTTVFTIFAITRKMYIRLHFLKRYRKKQPQTATVV